MEIDMRLIEAARRVADRSARSFACGRDPAQIEGTPTARAAALLARL